MNKYNLYTNTAFLYDFDNRDLLNDDLEICLNHVKETKGDILEIACGTGRVTIPVMKSTSRNITAFDLSDEMLSVLKSKLQNNNFSNLRIEKANMIDFDFGQKFGLVILTWRAFQFLISEEDAVKCLKCIKKHMDKDTVVVLSVFLPSKEYGANWIGKESVSYEIIDPKTNNKIRRSTKNLNSNEENQTIEYASIYNIVSPNGEHEIFEDKVILRYYYPEQIKKLLTDWGFTIIGEQRTLNDIFLTLKKEF